MWESQTRWSNKGPLFMLPRGLVTSQPLALWSFEVNLEAETLPILVSKKAVGF